MRKLASSRIRWQRKKPVYEIGSTPLRAEHSGEHSAARSIRPKLRACAGVEPSQGNRHRRSRSTERSETDRVRAMRGLRVPPSRRRRRETPPWRENARCGRPSPTPDRDAQARRSEVERGDGVAVYARRFLIEVASLARACAPFARHRRHQFPPLTTFGANCRQR